MTREGERETQPQGEQERDEEIRGERQTWGGSPSVVPPSPDAYKYSQKWRVEEEWRGRKWGKREQETEREMHCKGSGY